MRNRCIVLYVVYCARLRKDNVLLLESFGNSRDKTLAFQPNSREESCLVSTDQP